MNTIAEMLFLALNNEKAKNDSFLEYLQSTRQSDIKGGIYAARPSQSRH